MISAKTSDEVSKLENDVLSGTGFQTLRIFLKRAYVVRSQKSDGESDLSMLLEFFDYRSSLIGLLV